MILDILELQSGDVSGALAPTPPGRTASPYDPGMAQWRCSCILKSDGGNRMPNIFYIIGVIVVVIFVAGFLGLR